MVYIDRELHTMSLQETSVMFRDDPTRLDLEAGRYVVSRTPRWTFEKQVKSILGCVVRYDVRWLADLVLDYSDPLIYKTILYYKDEGWLSWSVDQQNLWKPDPLFWKLDDNTINAWGRSENHLKVYRLKGAENKSYCFLATFESWDNGAVAMGLTAPGNYAMAMSTEAEPDLFALRWRVGEISWLDTLHVGPNMKGITGNDEERYFIDYVNKVFVLYSANSECARMSPRCYQRSCDLQDL